MTCREYEPLIALYVEGDLEDAAVERHLAECAVCRGLLEDLRSSQAALKELAPEADLALLSEVRSGVLARIGEKRGMAWAWAAALVACAALLVLLSPAPVVKREPLVVKMLTSDPDVVIIWLVDQKGD